ncbi:uncharacterized protein METZ01_LOCUS489825 [marine metagenome]|uniref:Uncharacterized protein n=1 Tax=marine metagenome TaxID=408172 RepID=A0A383CXS9_9ZZZZ
MTEDKFKDLDNTMTKIRKIHKQLNQMMLLLVGGIGLVVGIEIGKLL